MGLANEDHTVAALTYRAYAAAAGWPLVPPINRVGGTSAGSTSIGPRDHDTAWINADVTKLVERGQGRGEH